MNKSKVFKKMWITLFFKINYAQPYPRPVFFPDGWFWQAESAFFTRQRACIRLVIGQKKARSELGPDLAWVGGACVLWLCGGHLAFSVGYLSLDLAAIC